MSGGGAKVLKILFELGCRLIYICLHSIKLLVSGSLNICSSLISLMGSQESVLGGRLGG